MKIEVLDEHIKRGRNMNCFRCPIAVAINEKLTNGDFASVGYDDIRFFHASGGIHYKIATTPRRAKAFINKFDQRKKVEPFSFNLDI